ncbi:histidine--tRNA ligase [Candidatus Soleaferrea massiliensis]|uniref:histidine--tRNA ligase n=1 Tax=Candidatus Soleaferrea massiliensis TaxID=1470354 RepID=UPI0005901DE3|nr:histidine--tRNA ligase [Candidatus Soleaferrea massiliensis]
MAILTKAPRGTQDVLPSDSYRWQYIEKTALDTAAQFGFQETRFPTFEHSALFTHSVGDTTDVVQKEMYSFQDKGGRDITLRPEGTAGVVRSMIEHGTLNDALPVRASYVTSCFRYEKPQAGRLREFHQFGIEMFGSAEPIADVQVIAVADRIFKNLGISNIALEINSIGCPVCRAKYYEALISYFKGYSDKLCATCLGRLEKNPMRILDCKSPVCSDIAKDAPMVIDYLCEECAEHFDKVKQMLQEIGISYTVNPTIVRGLDYYRRTVFEFVSQNIGAQGTVCGGGRYDGLVEILGGNPTPALGFAMGLERLLLLMDTLGCEFPQPKRCDIYIAPLGKEATGKANKMVMDLIEEGFAAQTDMVGRSLKAQMKYADKIGAKFTVVLGENEIQTGRVMLKNMQTGVSREVCLGNDLLSAVYDITVSETIDQITEEYSSLLGK